MSAMILTYLDILLRALIWFFNSGDYLFYLNYITYNIFFVDRLLVSSCILVIVGEHIPTVEKPGVQNLAARENEGKQWEPRMMKRK